MRFSDTSVSSWHLQQYYCTTLVRCLDCVCFIVRFYARSSRSLAVFTLDFATLAASLDMPLNTFSTHIKPPKPEDFVKDVVFQLNAAAVIVPLDGVEAKGGHTSFVSHAVQLNL